MSFISKAPILGIGSIQAEIINSTETSSYPKFQTFKTRNLIGFIPFPRYSNAAKPRWYWNSLGVAQLLHLNLWLVDFAANYEANYEIRIYDLLDLLYEASYNNILTFLKNRSGYSIIW